MQRLRAGTGFGSGSTRPQRGWSIAMPGTPDPALRGAGRRGTDGAPLTPSLSPSEGERVPFRAGEGKKAAPPIRRAFGCLLLCLGAILLGAGCRRDMFNQPYSKPLGESDFFEDNLMASRPLVPDTVARGQLREDQAMYTGMVGSNLVADFPFPITRQVLERGRERFEIYCAMCHGRTGEGNGMIVQRGFPPPPSYHIERLRQAPVGHFFDVITRGYGVMYPYAARVEPRDRWAIAAYIRALQLSQNATPADAPEPERAKLEAKK